MKRIRIPLLTFFVLFSFTISAKALSIPKKADVKAPKQITISKTQQDKKEVEAVSKKQVIPVRSIDLTSRGGSTLYSSKQLADSTQVNKSITTQKVTENITINSNVINDNTSSSNSSKKSSNENGTSILIELENNYIYDDSNDTNTDSTLKNPSYSNIEIPPNKIIDYAKQFLGVPYVTSGNGPDGFDCSGFTKYVFSHFDINIARRAIDQANEGIAVALTDLQPGDLVFFGNPAIHHVGIYAGNDYYIHSPRTGKVVSFAKFSSRKDFNCARRLIY